MDTKDMKTTEKTPVTVSASTDAPDAFQQTMLDYTVVIAARHKASLFRYDADPGMVN